MGDDDNLTMTGPPPRETDDPLPGTLLAAPLETKMESSPEPRSWRSKDKSQDYELSVNTTSPDLTVCFQDTFLAWIPCGLLWLATPFYGVYLRSRSQTNSWKSWSTLNLLKVIIGILLIILYATTAIYSIVYIGLEDELAKFITAIINCATSILITLLMRYGFVKGEHTSGVAFIYWFLQVLANIVPARSYVSGMKQDEESFWKITFYISFGLICLEFILQVFSDTKTSRVYGAVQLGTGEDHDVFVREERRPLLRENYTAQGSSYREEKLLPSPELTASFLSNSTYAWVTGLLWKGYKKPLQGRDLWDLMPRDRTKRLIDLFYKAWLQSSEMFSPITPRTTQYRDIAPNARLGTGKSGKLSYSTFSDVAYTSIDDAFNDLNAGQPNIEEAEMSKTWKTKASIVRAIVRAFGGYYMLAGVFEILNITVSFIRPTLLDYLIGFVETGDPFVWHGYVLAISLFLLNIIRALTTQKFYYGKFVSGVQIRGALTAAVYRKALRLSNSARNKYSVGQIVNLMSVDAQRVADVTFFIHDLWSAPVSITVAIYLLYSYLGPAAFAGLGVLLLLIGANLLIAGFVKKLQTRIMVYKDQRLKLTNEILNGMKVLKLYAWEKAFEERLNAIREKEVVLLRIVGYLTSGTAISFTCTPVLYAVVAFSVFSLTSGANALTPQVAFVSLTLVNALVRPLAYLPQGVAGLVQAAVCVKRLQDFLNDDELDEDAVDRDDTTGDVAIDVKNGTFSWDDETPTLKKINLRVRKGQLVAVVGQVGSGKSSLISALLGELRKSQGQVKVSGSVAYVPQEAWIRNESLQNNVLFGRESRKRKYDTVLDACALTEDLKMLPAGDQTEIGEKGINLSGGQKQRVSVARAVYQDADVYLLDDPLSAVDSHVAKHIFEQVIGEEGLLRNKTRVLVTHGITFLPRADVIAVVKDGQISELGSYQELLQHEGAFAEFIMTYLNEKEGEEDEDLDEKAVCDELRRQISALSIDIPSDGSGSDKSVVRRRSMRKQSSVSSHKSKMTRQTSKFTKPEVDKSKLTDKETTQSGGVKLATFWSYAKACGYLCVVSLVLGNLLFLGGDVGSNIWLSEWSEDANRDVPASTEYRLGIYAALGVGLAFSVLWQTTTLAIGCTRASKVLHMDLLKCIMRAPMAFFDTTPVGRVLNRFSQDLNVLDASMRLTIFLFVRGLMGLLATIVAITYTTPIFLAFVLPLFIIYYFVQRFYVITSNQLRRIMSVKTSPIYSHFGESIVGASSIRAYRQGERFTDISDVLVDDMQVAKYASILANRWLGVGMEIIGSSVVLFSAMYAVISKDTLTGGLVGLSISYALQVTDRLSVLVQNLSDLETNVVAVERINEYSEVPSEARWEIEDHRPPRDWPNEGQISFHSLSTRYRPGLDLVLKDITLKIHPQEKVGVVGRTGAGKSSMMLGLFRLVEPATGKIYIDGLDTGAMGLHDLRSKITIIPQDPVLFSGTLRSNLDPFETHPDHELWTALEQAYLKSYIDTLPGGLLYPCSEGGQNLSVGQRQLVCLARALLRKSKILVLDEATAAVDMETDELIQETIRSAFKDSTVLTIAHRLNTVMDYDRIMVLDAGKVKELGTPTQLLSNTKGAFYSMAKEANLV